jgi:hypothetical protein
MTRIGGARSLIALAVAVVVSAAGVVLTSVATPEKAAVDVRSQTVAASHSQLSCPETTTGKGLTTSLLAVSPTTDALGGSDGAGEDSLEVRALSPKAAEPIGEVDQIGTAVATLLGADARPSVTVDAAGSLAPAASASQRTTLDAGQRGGLEVAPCLPSADTWWFTGVDTSVGSTSRLVLSNPAPAVAAVDLTFYGPNGIKSAVGARGIPVAPQSRQVLDLARFAPGLDAFAVRVNATRGRVSAAVEIARVNGVTPNGAEWLAASQPPATETLVNAGDAGPGDQRLVITNPTAREALVQVQVLDSNGPFVPKNLSDVRIKPGRTVVKDVSDVTGASAAALRVTTQQEDSAVIASLVSESATGPVDLATTSSSAPLSGPAVVPVFTETKVAISFAGDVPGGTEAEIAAYDDRGAPVGQAEQVNVKPKTTVNWTTSPPDGAAYLVVTGEGLQGVATYHSPAGLSALPLASGATTITRPAVRPAS